jgi:hypothetical protein
MKKFFKRLLKRLYVKWALSTRYKMFNHNEQMDTTTKTSLSICRRLINHDNSKFLIAPLSGKRYIKNEEVDLFIIIYDNHLSITNHVYHYDVVLNQREIDKINNMYDNKTERIRQQFENEIMGQINNSLQSIQEKLVKKS